MCHLRNRSRTEYIKREYNETVFLRSARLFSRVNNGFTLIELLVIIAIISILSALLLPALRTAIGTSRSVVCASNMKQIGMVDSFYRSDYRNWNVYCHAPAGTTSSNYIQCWPWKRECFMEYMGLKLDTSFSGSTVYPSNNNSCAYPADFLCPEISSHPLRYKSTVWDNGRRHAVFTDSYSLVKPTHDSEMFSNRKFSHPTPAATYFRTKKIKSPSEKMRWCETAKNVYGTGWSTKYVLDYEYQLYLQSGSSTEHWIVGYRHPGESMNITYYDGHVKMRNLYFFEPHYNQWGFADTLFSILK